MKVLVVGGAGYVGTTIRPALERDHQCRHFDIRPVAGAAESIIGDVTDVPLVRRAVEGMEAVVYLAMGKLGDPIGRIHTSFDVNVLGLYLFLDAAGRAGIRRFVYSSSLSVYGREGYPFDEQPPGNEWGEYGISKRLGEYLCQAAVQEYPELCVVALRLMYPRSVADWPAYREAARSAEPCYALGPEDTRRLYLAALACEKPGAHVIQATGDVEQRCHSHQLAGEILGWLPRGA